MTQFFALFTGAYRQGRHLTYSAQAFMRMGLTWKSDRGDCAELLGAEVGQLVLFPVQPQILQDRVTKSDRPTKTGGPDSPVETEQP